MSFYYGTYPYPFRLALPQNQTSKIESRVTQMLWKWMQMALLLRVLCLTPTTTHLPTKHHYHVTPFSSFEFEKKEPYSKTNTNLLFRQPHPSFHPLRLSLAHTPSLIRTKEASSNFTLRLASTSQEQSLKTEAATEEEEEYSQTRLLAQNVPWTSTPEDIRSLFERHGKVLEVEVLFLSSFPLLHCSVFEGSIFLTRFFFVVFFFSSFWV